MKRNSAFSAAFAAPTTLLIVWAAAALLADSLVSPADAAISLTRSWAPPSADHPLGCDGLGRDVLARLTLGARSAFLIAVPGALAALALGGGLGAAAGVAGGRFDAVVRSLAELTTVFPRLVLALALSAVMGPSVVTAVVAFTLAAWPMAALPTRAQTLALRREEFVHAAEALGASRGHILRRHILPELWSGWLARTGGLIAQAALLEAALGVLGLGAQEPQASWGGMIRDGAPMLGQAPAMALSAAAAVFVVALAANLTADAIAHRLDPRRGAGIP